MVAAISSIHESNRQGQPLLNEVVQLFIDLLLASGATPPMIRAAIGSANALDSEGDPPIKFTDLGALLRDCMEVMCTWRRDTELVNADGEPQPLQVSSRQNQSFESLCCKVNARHSHSEILRALLEFGAVSLSDDGKVRSETPTFLLGRAASGGRLATDALLMQLAGFLRCVHRNVLSISGNGKSRFERACTVTVAIELEPVFDQLVRTRGQEFVDSLDEWLERNTRYQSPTGRYLELGVGAYYVDHGSRSVRKREHPDQSQVEI